MPYHLLDIHMKTYTADGIVLRRIDLGEKDRILTVYAK
jgi:recombinational DNA repair protein (RecF pathway)